MQNIIYKYSTGDEEVPSITIIIAEPNLNHFICTVTQEMIYKHVYEVELNPNTKKHLQIINKSQQLNIDNIHTTIIEFRYDYLHNHNGDYNKWILFENLVAIHNGKS